MLGRKRTYILIALAVVLLASGGYLLSRRSTPGGTNSAQSGAPAQVSTKGTGTNTQSADSSPSQQATGSSTVTAKGGGSAGGLLTPTGQFVSNHHASLSSSLTSKETSVCNTTPGASCTIQFTNGSSTKSLPSQVADTNGTTSWSWDVNALGLSDGNWSIKAVANSNGQTKSALDPLNLVVQP